MKSIASFWFLDYILGPIDWIEKDLQSIWFYHLFVLLVVCKHVGSDGEKVV